MSEKNSWLIVGKVVGAQGLRGEIKVNPSSDFPERFIKPGDRWLQKEEELPRKIKLIAGRQVPGKSIFVISLHGIINRNDAEELIGQSILVPSTSRPSLGKGEFHLNDLVGLKVRLILNDSEIGEVVNLKNAGNDLLEIKLLQGKVVLVPFVKAIVPEINIEAGWLYISPPPGLLEL